MSDQIAEVAEEVGTAAGYSFMDQQYAVNPWDLWAGFRKTPGLLRSDQDGGFWIASRFEEVYSVGANESLFCAREGRLLPPLPDRFLPGDSDGAPHRLYRKIMTPFFTNTAIQSAESLVRETCREVLAPLAGKDAFDMSVDFATPVILLIGMKWLHWPIEEYETFKRWAHYMMGPRHASPDEIMRSWREATEFVTNDLARRRLPENRCDDVVQAVVDAQMDGSISEIEAVQLVVSLFLGAVDTTASTLCYALYHLAGHPEDRRRLEAEPELMPRAVEEFLRLATTVTYIARTATEDVEVDGCQVKKGDRVALIFGSVNRDDREFPNPDEVVMERESNRHMAFGHGPHRCVGANFARLMLRTCINEAIATLGEFTVPDESLVEYEISELRVCRRLPVVHTPR